MHDGTPAHSSGVVLEFLDSNINSKWLGNGGPIPSPNLHLVDFFLWGHPKGMMVYETQFKREDKLLPWVSKMQVRQYFKLNQAGHDVGMYWSLRKKEDTLNIFLQDYVCLPVSILHDCW